MRLKALSGDRTGALQIYHECVAMLEQELDVSPSDETQTLYQQIQKAEIQVAPIAVQPERQQNEQPPLIGRMVEWQMLHRAWEASAWCGPHLVCVWGEAG